jgi:uncharacterized protein with gpF-like domain
MVKPKTLKSTSVNVGIQRDYEKKLAGMAAEMAASINYWVPAAYRKNVPMATDADPASLMNRVIKKLADRWIKKFADAALKMAEYYTTSIDKRDSAQLKSALKDSGIMIDFKTTPEMDAILTANIQQQVELIKSIPEQYFTKIQGAVMRSVSVGGDLKTLTDELMDMGHSTQKRAEFIARDQSRKAFSTIKLGRMKDIGVIEGIWKHSHAGRKPRPSHLAADGERFKLSEGLFLDGKWTVPGYEPNCGCTFRPILPELKGDDDAS